MYIYNIAYIFLIGVHSDNAEYLFAEVLKFAVWVSDSSSFSWQWKPVLWGCLDGERDLRVRSSDQRRWRGGRG